MQALPQKKSCSKPRPIDPRGAASRLIDGTDITLVGLVQIDAHRQLFDRLFDLFGAAASSIVLGARYQPGVRYPILARATSEQMLSEPMPLVCLTFLADTEDNRRRLTRILPPPIAAIMLMPPLPQFEAEIYQAYEIALQGLRDLHDGKVTVPETN